MSGGSTASVCTALSTRTLRTFVLLVYILGMDIPSDLILLLQLAVGFTLFPLPFRGVLFQTHKSWESQAQNMTFTFVRTTMVWDAQTEWLCPIGGRFVWHEDSNGRE